MAVAGVTAAIVGGPAVGESVAAAMLWVVATVATRRAGGSGAAPEVVVRPTVEGPPTGGAGRVRGGT